MAGNNPTKKLSPNLLDRVFLALAPRLGLERMRARAAALTMARHYEAASGSWRTTNWQRSSGDANAANGPALHILRGHARDILRNNSWARKGMRVITNSTVGAGIYPGPVVENAALSEAWQRWADTTACDADGRLPFYGLQKLVLRSVARDGEVLVRRRRRRLEDGLPIPLQLQVLEADFLDTNKDGMRGEAGGPIIQGVEFDKLGRRAAYWLFDQHPGATRLALGGGSSFTSRRVPASEILHIYDLERAGEARGITWLAAPTPDLKMLDEMEDAELMRQKIAACFTAFVVDPQGAGLDLGTDDEEDEGVQQVEPGQVHYLDSGQDVRFGTPPTTTDTEFHVRQLRRIAAGMGVTYEDLTGDYSKVNYSSGRMGRLAFWSNVEHWQWMMLVPQFCSPIWAWAMEALQLAGTISDTAPAPLAEWTPPAMAAIDPDKEVLADVRAVRAGRMTPSEMVRRQGWSPRRHWAQYAADVAALDQLGIQLDIDVRKVNQTGQAQSTGGGAKPEAKGNAEDATEDAAT